jgi:hypothetical protein
MQTDYNYLHRHCEPEGRGNLFLNEPAPARRDLKMTLLLRLLHACLSITTSIQARSGPGIASLRHAAQAPALRVAMTSMSTFYETIKNGSFIFSQV